jgi:LysM repeat protein
MRKLPWRRVGVILSLVVMLSLILVPAASASGAAAPTGSAAAGQTCFYRVVRGDNLIRLAHRFRTSVWQLMAWNGVQNPDRVYAGQLLRVCAPTPPVLPPPPPPRPCQSPCAPPPPPPCSWSCASSCAAPAPGPWNGEYFNNQDLSGNPTFVRQDGSINFNWGWGSPSAQSICSDHFSARWTGRFNFVCGGNYRFTAVVDDGVRVWVDGNPIIDQWAMQSVRTFSGDTWLDAGGHDVRVEYFEQTGVAEMHLNWSKLP